MTYKVVEENLAEKMFNEANKPPSKIMKILTESGLVAKEESPNWIYFLVALVVFLLLRLLIPNLDIFLFLLGYWFCRLTYRAENRVSFPKFPPIKVPQLPRQQIGQVSELPKEEKKTE